MTHFRQMSEELFTQDKVDLLNQMADSNISLEVGVAFIEQMLQASNIDTLLQERREFQRIVRSNYDNLTRLASQAIAPVVTPEEVAAIQKAIQIMAAAFNIEEQKS